MHKAALELEAFRKLLDEFAEYHPLVNYTHRILCETHKNLYIKLGQPKNKMGEDGLERGPCGNECYVEILNWGARYCLGRLVGDVIKDIDNTIRIRILRKK